MDFATNILGEYPRGSVVFGVLKDATAGFVSVQTVCFVLWVDFYRAWT